MARPETIAAIRFGYGLGPGQGGGSDARELIADLRAPSPNATDRRAKHDFVRAFRDARGDREEQQRLRKEARAQALGDLARRIERKATSPHAFAERLAAFWADHFTVSYRNAFQMILFSDYEDRVIRPRIGGRFAELLKGVLRAPSMLVYLDQIVSVGPNSHAGRRSGRGLNENLAREVLELHTLGAGGPYTQADVRELAELLTGFGIDGRTKSFRFHSRRAEPGSETVLGRAYGGNPAREGDVDELAEDLAAHPATARHLATKLAVHFIADRPEADLVRAIERAWRDSGGDLTVAVSAMLEHPASWRPELAKVKRPQDLLISTIRATGAPLRQRGREIRRGREYFRALRAMGQIPMRSPGPDGWPEEAEAWISPQGLAARLTFAEAAGRRLAGQKGLDPRHFADQALGDMLSRRTAGVVRSAADRAEGFALLIASPEFNRR